MDPLTAWANAVAAIANLLTELARGMPEAIKMQVWAWWRDDMERWRKFWKIDERMAARDAARTDGPILDGVGTTGHPGVKRGTDERGTGDDPSPAKAAGS
jgi:hypothetical protein